MMTDSKQEALAQALRFHQPGGSSASSFVSDTAIVATAMKFEAYLEGKAAPAKKSKKRR